MKVLNKKKLIDILNAVVEDTLDIKDITSIFDYFGDDYFIVDGTFAKTKEGKNLEPNQRIILNEDYKEDENCDDDDEEDEESYYNFNEIFGKFLRRD